MSLTWYKDNLLQNILNNDTQSWFSEHKNAAQPATYKQLWWIYQSSEVIVLLKLQGSVIQIKYS